MVNLKILVIDDDKGISKLIGAMLARGGHTTLIANSGEAGLALHQAECPDLVLLDLLMPGMDGFTVLAQMRAYDQAHNRRTLILFLTAHAQSYSLERTRHGFDPDTQAAPHSPEQDADGCIAKPVTMHRLLEQVDAFWEAFASD